MISRILPSGTTALKIGVNTSRFRIHFSNCRLFSTTQPQTPSSVSFDKMETDKRYQPTTDVPESLLNNYESDATKDGFSILGQFREGRAAYLDMSSTTPVDPRVFDAMAPYMIGSYGNPHSKTHAFGWEAESAVEKARAQVAALISGEHTMMMTVIRRRRNVVAALIQRKLFLRLVQQKATI